MARVLREEVERLGVDEELFVEIAGLGCFFFVTGVDEGVVESE